MVLKRDLFEKAYFQMTTDAMDSRTDEALIHLYESFMRTEFEIVVL